MLTRFLALQPWGLLITPLAMPGRFEFALTNLAATQWESFEALASKFLSDDFPTLRTMAAAHGNKGRDAQLHQPLSDP
jgi:hypothetical protein